MHDVPFFCIFCYYAKKSLLSFSIKISSLPYIDDSILAHIAKVSIKKYEELFSRIIYFKMQICVIVLGPKFIQVRIFCKMHKCITFIHLSSKVNLSAVFRRWSYIRWRRIAEHIRVLALPVRDSFI